MSSIVIAGDTSGSVTLQAPAVSGSTILTLPATSGTVQTSGAGFTTNGVAYASSSSALATGSALVFDGTNLGIGISAPGTILNVVGTTGIRVRGANSASDGALELRADNTSCSINAATFGTAVPLLFKIDNTERMRIDSSGRLLVGTTSGSGANMFIVNQPAASTDAKTIVSVSTGTNAAFTAFVNTTVTTVGTENSSGGSLVSGSSAYSTVIANNGAYPISFGTNNTERARIDSSGNLLVGTTSAYGTGTTIIPAGLVFVSRNADVSGVFDRTGSSNGDAVQFRHNGNTVGSVSVTSSATAYNTSSDYRLKNTITPMTGALAKVALLKPCTYKWNVDGSDGEGFIAHELAEVCPNAVNGEKDAVDEEGNPQYQGIDTSFLVATLTAALQEQQAIIESLKARLDAANL